MGYAEIYWIVDGVVLLLKLGVGIGFPEIFHLLNFSHFFLFPDLIDQSLFELCSKPTVLVPQPLIKRSLPLVVVFEVATCEHEVEFVEFFHLPGHFEGTIAGLAFWIWHDLASLPQSLVHFVVVLIKLFCTSLVGLT